MDVLKLSLMFLFAVACCTPAEESPLVHVDRYDRSSEMATPDADTVDTMSLVPVIPDHYDGIWYLAEPGRWDHERWSQNVDSTGDLSQRIADFDGDGSNDRAFLLCRTDSVHPDSAYALVVAFSNGRDTLLGTFTWAEALGTIGTGITSGPPGELRHLGSDDGEREAPGVAPHSTLTLIYFEKSAMTWFWVNGVCFRVWIAD